jgi:hypothetical protein
MGTGLKLEIVELLNPWPCCGVVELEEQSSVGEDVRIRVTHFEEVPRHEEFHFEE